MTAQPVQWQPMQPMYAQQPQTQTQSQPSAVSTAPEKEIKPWWKVWITQNKVGVISAIVIFALLYFIYPRITGLERFSGQRLPTSVIAGMSIIAASGVTAINLAI